MIVSEVSRRKELQSVCANNEVTLVRFGADWCPNSGLVDQVLQREFPFAPAFCEVEVDDSPELVRMFRVDTVPVVITLNSEMQVISRIQTGQLSEANIIALCKGE